MSTAKFMMSTIATCEPTYMEQALKHVGAFVGDLFSKAGSVGARYGVIATGEHAGSIALFQSYENLAGIEKAFQVYAESSDYQSIISSGKLSVAMRNITKLEDVNVSKPSSDTPKYGVVTVFSGSLFLDQMSETIPLWESNGAMLIRYGTLVTGSHTGMRFLVAAYPSMDAIEKTYDALRSSAIYKKILTEVDLDRRNIVRIVG